MLHFINETTRMDTKRKRDADLSMQGRAPKRMRRYPPNMEWDTYDSVQASDAAGFNDRPSGYNVPDGTFASNPQTGMTNAITTEAAKAAGRDRPFDITNPSIDPSSASTNVVGMSDETQTFQVMVRPHAEGSIGEGMDKEIHVGAAVFVHRSHGDLSVSSDGWDGMASVYTYEQIKYILDNSASIAKNGGTSMTGLTMINNTLARLAVDSGNPIDEGTAYPEHVPLDVSEENPAALTGDDRKYSYRQKGALDSFVFIGYVITSGFSPGNDINIITICGSGPVFVDNTFGPTIRKEQVVGFVERNTKTPYKYLDEYNARPGAPGGPGATREQWLQTFNKEIRSLEQWPNLIDQAKYENAITAFEDMSVHNLATQPFSVVHDMVGMLTRPNDNYGQLLVDTKGRELRDRVTRSKFVAVGTILDVYGLSTSAEGGIHQGIRGNPLLSDVVTMEAKASDKYKNPIYHGTVKISLCPMGPNSIKRANVRVDTYTLNRPNKSLRVEEYLVPVRVMG